MGCGKYRNVNGERQIILNIELSHPYDFYLYCCNNKGAENFKVVNKDYYADGGVSKCRLRELNNIYYYWNDVRWKKKDTVPRKYGLRFTVDKTKYVDKLTDLEGEEWKEIPNTGGFYLVSNKGRVKSRKKKGKEIELSKLYAKGYHRVCISYVVGKYSSGKPKLKRVHEFVHKLVAEAFMGKPVNFGEVKYIIDHIDRNKINNYSKNLRYATCSENSYNCSDKKIMSDEVALKYLRLYRDKKFSLTEICRYSGYSYTQVEYIMKGKTRRNLYEQIFGEE